MSSQHEIINAEGDGWRVWTGLRSGPMLDIQVALGGAVVTVPIPLDLARRISGEPEVKLVQVAGADLKPHWLHLLQRLKELGAHDKRSARPLFALYYGPTPPSMRGAAMALWRREYLGRTSAPGGSHYWLTEKGQRLLISSKK